MTFDPLQLVNKKRRWACTHRPDQRQVDIKLRLRQNLKSHLLAIVSHLIIKIVTTVGRQVRGHIRANRQNLLALGVGTVSLNGAKGRKVTPEDQWNSPEYQAARNARSAVESLIFTLRYKFHLYRFSRRGIEDVRIEMYEKVIVHNLWRAVLLRGRAAREKPAQLKAA